MVHIKILAPNSYSTSMHTIAPFRHNSLFSQGKDGWFYSDVLFTTANWPNNKSICLFVCFFFWWTSGVPEFSSSGRCLIIVWQKLMSTGWSVITLGWSETHAVELGFVYAAHSNRWWDLDTPLLITLMPNNEACSGIMPVLQPPASSRCRLVRSAGKVD